MPVRIGFPIGISGLTQMVQGPQFATGVGLVRHGAAMLREAQDREYSRVAPRVEQEEAVIVKREGNRIWQWLREAF